MNNKIYNMDCLLGIKDIPDNYIDLVIIDPPYDICTKGGKKGNTKIARNIKALEKELINIETHVNKSSHTGNMVHYVISAR